MERPVCATEDERAVFIRDRKVSLAGKIHRTEQGKIGPFTVKDVLC